MLFAGKSKYYNTHGIRFDIWHQQRVFPAVVTIRKLEENRKRETTYQRTPVPHL